jgi:hypothetical protein
MRRPLVIAAALALALGTGGAPRAVANGPGAPPVPQPPAAPAAAAPAPSLQIQVFSMGQADAMLIVGRARSVLVDCGVPGKGYKNRHKKVADTIKRMTGGARVDALVITHFHSDHVGEPPDGGDPGRGVWGLVDEGIRFGTIYDHGDRYPAFGEESWPHKQWARWLPRWRSARVFDRRRVPARNERIDLGGGAELRFLAANGNGVLESEAWRFRHGVSPNENDYSLAFVVRSGAFEMFSGGDLSGSDSQPQPGRDDVYTDIETRIARAVGNVEVLRANHHGSRHSTNGGFAQTLRPEVSIISCGKDNSYGHPAVEVVRRLAAQGLVWNTSGLARDWRNRSDAPEVAGDIAIRVAHDGATYSVTGRNGQFHAGRSYADWEEAIGLDRRGAGGGPRIPFLAAAGW